MKRFVKRLKDKFYEIFDGVSVGVNGIFLVLIFVITFTSTVLQKGPLYYIKKANIIDHDIVHVEWKDDKEPESFYVRTKSDKNVNSYRIDGEIYFIETELKLKDSEKIRFSNPTAWIDENGILHTIFPLYKHSGEECKGSTIEELQSKLSELERAGLVYDIIYKEDFLLDCQKYFEGNFLNRLWVCAKNFFLFYLREEEGIAILFGAMVGTFFIEVFCKSIVCFVVRRKKED